MKDQENILICELPIMEWNDEVESQHDYQQADHINYDYDLAYNVWAMQLD